MMRSTILAGTAMVFACLTGIQAASAAQDPACKPTKWTLEVPQGMDSGEAVIVETPENHVWRVGVGGVPADATLVIEYRSTVGTKSEVILGSGAAELVDGASVKMRLQRGASPARLAVSGTYNIKCGKK